MIKTSCVLRTLERPYQLSIGLDVILVIIVYVPIPQTCLSITFLVRPSVFSTNCMRFRLFQSIVGPICNNFEKNRAFYDKSMKLGTWLVDNKTKKSRVSATPKMSSNGRHLVFPKWPPFSTYSL